MPDDSGTGAFSFSELRKLEFTIAAELNKLRELASRRGLTSYLGAIDATLGRIESHSFAIAVVGEFKRGKSTFINALLGQEILPADVAPASATLNRVTYGTKPSIHIKYWQEEDRARLPQSIGIDELPAYVTKLTPESEAMAAKVEEAVIFFPSRFCLNNVSIIDTPGLGDEQRMTDVTLGVLPSVDAAILVIMPESPFSGSEGEFLNKHLLQDLHRIFFVVTAIDRIPRARDRERVLAYVENRIVAALQAHAAEVHQVGSESYDAYLQQLGRPQVFGLSGYDGLQGKLTGNTELVISSGLLSFEKSLEQFLTEERGLLTLRAASESLASIAYKMTGEFASLRQEVTRERELHDQACSVALETLAALRSTCTEKLEEVKALTDRCVTPTKAAFEQMITELVNAGVAEVDTADISAAEIKKASLAAVGNALGTLTSKIPDNVQSSARSGLRRLFGSLPSNWQATGQQAVNKVVEKSQAGIQQYARSEIMEELGRHMTTVVATANEAWFAAAPQTFWTVLQQEASAFEDAAVRVEQQLRAIHDQLLHGSEPIRVTPLVAALPQQRLEEILSSRMQEFAIDCYPLLLRSAATTTIAGAGTPASDAEQRDASQRDAEQLPDQNANKPEVADGEIVKVFRKACQSTLRDALSARLEKSELRKQAVELLTTTAEDVKRVLAEAFDRLAVQIERTAQEVSQAQQVQMLVIEREAAALDRDGKEVGSLTERSNQRIAQLLR